MSSRKATPDVLGELLAGVPVPVEADDADIEAAPHGESGSVARTREMLPTIGIPVPVAPLERDNSVTATQSGPEWEYLELTLRNYRGWRPRLINGLIVDDWKDGPDFRTYLESLGGDGWEMVGIVSLGRSERDVYFKRPKV